MKNSHRSWPVYLLLTAILVAGMVVRLYPLGSWLEHQDRFFFESQDVPLLVTVDGYFYLEAAQAVQQGTYGPIDHRRHVPVGHERAPVPPLLSLLVAGVNALTGVPLEWIAVLLPGILGPLLAVPTWLVCTALLEKVRLPGQKRDVCSSVIPWAGLVAASLAIFSPMYLERSAIGWLDTDILNISLALTLCFLGMRIAESQSDKEGGVALGIFITVAALFAWWWDQSLTAVVALAAIPLSVALSFLFFRERKRCVLLFLCLMLCCVGIGWWKGWGTINPKEHVDYLVNTYRYIQADGVWSVFQPSGRTVSEQASAHLGTIIDKGFGWLPAFIVAGSFFVLLALFTRGYALFLAGIVIVGLLSFNGLRFIIFLAPLFGLGGGFAVYTICCLIRRRWVQLAVVATVLSIVGYGLLDPVKSLQWRVPRRLPILFEAMANIKEHAPEKSVVWASWGHGHPLVFYTDRGVIADGMYHSAELQYVLNFPLAVASDRLAANWIAFYVARGPAGLRRINASLGKGGDDWEGGLGGLQRILAAGPGEGRTILREKYGKHGAEGEKLLQFIFPVQQRPVFLLLDYLMLNQAWYSTGQWGVAGRKRAARQHFITMDRVQFNNDGTLRARNLGNDIVFDIRTGMMNVDGSKIPLRSVAIRAGEKILRKKYNRLEGMVLSAHLAGAVGAVGSPEVTNALLPKLFYEMIASRYFTPVDKQMPFYVLLQVNGEAYH